MDSNRVGRSPVGCCHRPDRGAWTCRSFTRSAPAVGGGVAEGNVAPSAVGSRRRPGRGQLGDRGGVGRAVDGDRACRGRPADPKEPRGGAGAGAAGERRTAGEDSHRGPTASARLGRLRRAPFGRARRGSARGSAWPGSACGSATARDNIAFRAVRRQGSWPSTNVAHPASMIVRSYVRTPSLVIRPHRCRRLMGPLGTVPTHGRIPRRGRDGHTVAPRRCSDAPSVGGTCEAVETPLDQCQGMGMYWAEGAGCGGARVRILALKRRHCPDVRR